MTYYLQQTLNALQTGSIYALIAMGYTMVYGILTMINFAHGDVFMVGAFFCLLAVTFLGLSFIPALLCAMLGCALLGVLIERLAYNPMRDAPRMSLIITALGMGLILEHVTLAITPYSQKMPDLLPLYSWVIGGVHFTSLQAAIILLSILLMFGLDFFVRRTTFGIAIRAIAWDRTTTSLMGVPVNRIISLTFALGAALAGAAGTLYAMAYPVIDPYMGVMIGWKAFIAAVIGGIGNIRGAILGAYILGAVEIFVAAAIPSTYRDFVAFALLLVLLIIRPHGILGQPRPEKV